MLPFRRVLQVVAGTEHIEVASIFSIKATRAEAEISVLVHSGVVFKILGWLALGSLG